MNARSGLVALALLGCTEEGEPARVQADALDRTNATEVRRSVRVPVVPDATDVSATVRITRDARGVPRIEADRLETAMYGLGRAMAEDRLFQMTVRRLRVSGRLSEVFAVVDPTSEGEEALNARLLESDVESRTLGFAREADRALAAMPAERAALFAAFARGVNAHIQSTDALGPAFDEHGITSVELWDASDALAGWDHSANLFARPLVRAQEEIASLNRCAGGACPPLSCGFTVIDDEAAVVQQPEDGVWPPGGVESLLGMSLQRPRKIQVDLKASQGLVVSGDRSESGAPMVFGEPQILLEAPSWFYEHQIVVEPEGINARGIGFPGSPGMIMFYNEHVAQTVTSGGGDVADLFEITRGSSGFYVVDGEEVPLTQHRETIRVRGGDAVDLTVEETRYGPIVSSLLDAVPTGRSFALRHAEWAVPERHSALAGIDLMQATNLTEYRAAISQVVAPTVNALYGGVNADDGEDHIAYHALTTIPRRSALVIGDHDLTGQHPYDGSVSDNDWDGFYGIDMNPHVIDPESGVLFSGNHLAVGSWYEDVVYGGFGGNGDTFRSHELRRRVAEWDASGSTIGFDELHELHADARSEVVLGVLDALERLESQGILPEDLPDEVPRDLLAVGARVKSGLVRWRDEGGGLLDQRSVGYRLALGVVENLIMFAREESFACTWGAAEGGAAHFLRAFAADPSVLGRVEAGYVMKVARKAWIDTLGSEDADVRTWTAASLDELPASSLPHQRDFFCLDVVDEDSCSMQPDWDLDIVVPHAAIHSITSTRGSMWPFTVDLSDPDSARALMAPGMSEDPTSPRYEDQVPTIEAKGAGNAWAIPLSPLSWTGGEDYEDHEDYEEVP